MKSLSVLFLMSLLLSFLFIPLSRKIFLRFGKLDMPDARKLHTLAVPRSGGLAIFSAFLISVVCFSILPTSGSKIIEGYTGFLTRLLPAIGIVCITGFLDDWHEIRPKYKLMGQFVAAILAYWAGIRIFDPVPGWEWASFAATAFWLILCSNAFNLVDGADGLAGTLAVVSCIGLIIVALSWDYYPLALVFTPLLGATIPFLRANWPPASLFLGDTGSLTLGFVIGCGGATLSRHFPDGGGLIAAILILTLPLMEVALSTTRRILRGQPVFQADSFHIHHQLKRQGLCSSRVLMRLGAVTLFGTAIAITQIHLGAGQRSFLILPFLALLAHDVTRLRYPEFAVLGEALLGGRARRWLQNQIRLRSFENDLRAAVDSPGCCEVLQRYAVQIGIDDLSICLNGEKHRPALNTADGPGCNIRVDLPNRSWLNFRTTVGESGRETPASEYAAIAVRVLTPRLALLQREVRVLDRSA